MPSFSLNHIALSVKDVARSIAFYQTLFGFQEIENTASASKTRWLVFDNGQQLHLIDRPHADIIMNKAVHFAFDTPDFDGFVAKLEALQIPYSDWPDTPDKSYIRRDGIRQVYFQDPDGYWVEVNDNI